MSKTAKSLSLQIGGGNFKAKPKSIPTRNFNTNLPKPNSYNSYMGNSFNGGPVKPIRGNRPNSKLRSRPYTNQKNRPQSPAEFFYSGTQKVDPYATAQPMKPKKDKNGRIRSASPAGP